THRHSLHKGSRYFSSQGSIACSPMSTIMILVASACTGFSSTLNVSGTIADGTVKSAVDPPPSRPSPSARVTSVLCGQSGGSSSAANTFDLHVVRRCDLQQAIPDKQVMNADLEVHQDFEQRGGRVLRAIHHASAT